jgi:hypothetical protein
MLNTVILIKNGDHAIYLRHRRKLGKNVTEAGGLGKGEGEAQPLPKKLLTFYQRKSIFFNEQIFFSLLAGVCVCVCVFTSPPMHSQK